jgi:hypothetical protein
MTVEEMARIVIELTPEDEQSLREVAEVETAAFEEYLSDYQVQALRVCKGCHGG